jgi:hypothetical protein
LDIASLTGFVTSDSAFIVTWYDQSGSGNNVTQSTANAQPMIVNAGTVLLDANNRPYMSLDGSNDFLVGGANGYLAAGSGSYLVSTVARANAIDKMIFSQGSANTNQYVGFYVQSSSGFASHFWFGNDLSGPSTNLDDTNLIAALYFNGTTRSTNINLLTLTSDTPAGKNTAQSGVPFYLGRATFGPGYFLDGRLQECIIWNSNQNANVSGIKTDQNTYYNVY